MRTMENRESLMHQAPIDRAIAMAEAVLHECDEHGFVFAAIDISSALDKLRAIRDESGTE
ncbi:hypothetical protein MACH24_31100 [Erythrobacter sp. Dej080120_24]|nr:hypothetical protein MACH24_31100 [Erythrobacter sp. Dej080120_24]